MEADQKVLMVDAGTSFYRVDRYKIGDYFGPIDLGLKLSQDYNSLNIGIGLLAGSIFPGSNRLMFTGMSPCWHGFYISSMGGAGLVFENLGINMLSIVGKAATPSIMYLNRNHGEEINVEIRPVPIHKIWDQGRKGLYSLMDYTYEQFGKRYANDPRILTVGPSAETTDVGAICSVPIKNGKLTFVDTWAGRGGFGSKLYREHHIVAIIYGGTFIYEDFRDRKVADEWFVNKYQKKLAVKDMEATAKYRFEPKFKTGGTFGVNYSMLKGEMMSFNYNSIYWSEEKRLKIHNDFVVNHYLKQFNEETIDKKQQSTCGEPCVAVCKKMNGEFKKDYEPYQTMGPLSGIFDQRAAERLNHQADMLGFDGISGGGVVAWLLDCLDKHYLTMEEVGVTSLPEFDPDNFDVVKSSNHNADLGIEILNSIVEKKGIIDLSKGARKLARDLAREKHNKKILDAFLFIPFSRGGWMVPNQYWVPGAISPMAIMGKYYMHYGNDFLPPLELGKKDASRLKGEMLLDNLGICRFHRLWAEEMMPEVIGQLYNMEKEYIRSYKLTAKRIASRNASVFWESEKCVDYIHTFLKRKRDVGGSQDPVLLKWIEAFDENKIEAARSFWYEIHRGIQESMDAYEVCELIR